MGYLSAKDFAQASRGGQHCGAGRISGRGAAAAQKRLRRAAPARRRGSLTVRISPFSAKGGRQQTPAFFAFVRATPRRRMGSHGLQIQSFGGPVPAFSRFFP